MIEEDQISESKAFMEYKYGKSPKVRPPWITIVSIGILVGVSYIITEVFAAIVLGNPYALNFVLGLYGIPAGFVCAWKNKDLTFMTSMRYSTFSALISVGTFTIISFITMALSSEAVIGAIIGFVQLLIASAIIAIYSIFVTFALGAMMGTFIHGVVDDKR
ncbi:MAG: hypothetical protein FK730_09660 [Asgard group archaeon]|nr:hypothetical protein [Asgard group archaeon]